MSEKYSSIHYRGDDGDINEIIIPTIQQLNVPDSSKIPSKPTITGEYRQQYVINTAPKITFQVDMDDDVIGKYTINTSDFVDLFSYLKDNRIKFNLVTSHSGEESQFLSDLIIQNVQYTRKANLRNNLVATITCTRIKSIDLEWRYVDVVEIFGKNIFTSTGDTTVQSWNFKLGSVNSDMGLMYKGDLGSIFRKPDNTTEKVGAELDSQMGLNSRLMYFKLSEPIEMYNGSRTINASAQFTYDNKGIFTTAEGVEKNTVESTLVKLQIDVKKDEEVSAEECIPFDDLGKFYYEDDEFHYDFRFSKLLGLSRIRFNPKPEYRYNFCNTYNGYLDRPSSFENLKDGTELQTFLEQNTQNLTKDTRGILCNEDYIYATPINKQYSYTISIPDLDKTIVEHRPTGGLDMSAGLHSVTDADGYKPDFGDLQAQLDKYAHSAGYNLYIFPVTVGTMLQIYLLEPDVLTVNTVAGFSE